MGHSNDEGYAMAALLVAMSVMAVFLSVALPSWLTMAKREREAELVFRGQQYARAVTLFQRKFAGAYPPSLDILLNQKFLRKKYKDPITNDDFQLVPVGSNAALQAQGAQTPGGPAGTAPVQGRGGPPLAAQQPVPQGGNVPGAGIQGVVSKSTAESLRLYNGRQHYNEWVFIATPASTAAGGAQGTGRGTQAPGAPGQPGIPARGGGRQGPANVPPGVGGFPGRGPGGGAPPFGQPPGAPPGGARPGMPPGPGGVQPNVPFPGGQRGR